MAVAGGVSMTSANSPRPARCAVLPSVFPVAEATAEQFRALLAANADLLYLASADWNRVRSLGEGSRLMSSEGWTDDWMQRFIPAEEHAFMRARIQPAIQAKSVLEMEHHIFLPDGGQGWIYTRAVPVLDKAGNIVEWLGAVADVSARQRIEQALRRSEHRLQEVFETLEEGLILLDFSSAMLELNRAARRLHGGTERVDSSVDIETFAAGSELFALDHTPLDVQQRPLYRLRRGQEVHNWELVVCNKKSHKERVCSFTTSVVRNLAGKTDFGLMRVRDVTALRQAQQMLVQNEKLASVGRLATTLAHEINNPLSTVINALFLVGSETTLSDSARANLKVAENELRRIVHITRQTLRYSHPSDEPQRLEVNEIIDGTLVLYASKLNNKFARIERRDRGPAIVYAAESDLRQIFSTFIDNAVDALLPEGRLTLRTCCSRDPRAPQRMTVRVTVADNGDGIAAESLPHIFEPFFTTKKSYGTGLGLWVAHELVTRWGGQIRVRSRRGCGTVFSFRLPLADSSPARSEGSS